MLRPLQHLTTTEVAASDRGRDILKQKEIGDFWVSSQSQWRDLYWQFENETAGLRAHASRIRWDVSLPDGSRLTDFQWAPLLDAFKRFTWSLFNEPRGYYGRPLKPGSAGALHTSIRYLARWMIRRNFLSFSELDNVASELFLEDVAEEVAQTDLQPSDREESMSGSANDSPPAADGEGLSPSQVYSRVIIWLQLWRQTGALRDAGIPTLPFHSQRCILRELSISTRETYQPESSRLNVAFPCGTLDQTRITSRCMWRSPLGCNDILRPTHAQSQGL
jgi:hypothetical protein